VTGDIVMACLALRVKDMCLNLSHFHAMTTEACFLVPFDTALLTPIVQFGLGPIEPSEASKIL
jgi:hypothetical protein